MVAQIVIRGPNVVHGRIPAVFECLGQLGLCSPTARGTQELGCLRFVAAVRHPFENQLIFSLYLFAFLGRRRGLHDPPLHEAEKRRLRNRNVFGYFGHRPAVWRRFEGPLLLRESRNRFEKIVARGLELLQCRFTLCGGQWGVRPVVHSVRSLKSLLNKTSREQESLWSFSSA